MIVQNRMVIIDALREERTLTFRVRIHKADSPVEQLIEPEFYQEFAGKIHEGVHHEMELVDSPVWGRVNPDVPIHIHENPESKRRFVCFTGNIPTLEAALAVLRMWCVGTVYAIVRNEDFGRIARDAGNHFVEVMRDRYSIVISGDMEVARSTTAIGEKGIAQVGTSGDCEDGGILRI